MPVSVGMKGRAEAVVTQDNAAVTAGSGTLPVFATPWMCALMEKASWTITHDSATPLGLKVWAESQVTAVDGRRIEFQVTAYDERGLIGQGTHERFVVADDRFLAKAQRKLEG